MIDGLHLSGPLSGIFARWYEKDIRVYSGGPALFLDRDGVIVEDTHYLSSPGDISFIPGVAEALRSLRDLNIPVIVVTNQAGIGKGYYGWDAFAAVQKHINDYVRDQGGFISGCVACPYHPEGKNPYRHGNHPFRKPNPGMILWALKSANIDRSGSWLAGDKLSDLQAGALAGLAGLAHVSTGQGKKEAGIAESWSGKRTDVIFVDSLKEVVMRFIKMIKGLRD
ncbi:D-glycero-D-manno-heptose 1,7-bisphosphate phosphatase [Desulfocucumis palustris]|uniref:D,D-heptose 1,7-bisphosphate phosphatase n=1 Tax=Desulfocucumis palustris TaxID=1898651 RepID=A0A2L2XGT7_9FIRM|nr:HAD family hydrolase [Desulfocucumis palustris]GBF33436.1 D-glycero-D-manno-heptose 1,7-bisphosphate phosphatase [Desulfocucumis palustris]